jgi:hypothetical protein
MEDEYVEKLKKWIDYDNSITELKEQLSKLNEDKKEIEDVVLKYVEDNNLSGVNVTISDGLLKFPKRKVQQGITMKYIRATLNKYKDETNQHIEIDDICKFLMSNLDTKQKVYIKRDYKDG